MAATSRDDDGVRRLSEVSRQKKTAVLRFNTKPQLGLEYLLGLGLWDGSPSELARWLSETPGLSKRRIGDFFGGTHPLSEPTFDLWLEQTLSGSVPPPKEVVSSGEKKKNSSSSPQKNQKSSSSSPTELDEALRTLLQKFRLPGEAQCIDRIVARFARALKNAGQWAYSEDAAYVLSFSVVMLNTDLHSSALDKRRRMTSDEFLANNKCLGLPEALLSKVYENVKSAEIKMDDGDLYEPSEEVTFMGARKAGFLEKRGLVTKRYWFVLCDGCLYYFSGPADVDRGKPPRATIPLDQGLAVIRPHGAAPARDFSIVRKQRPPKQPATSTTTTHLLPSGGPPPSKKAATTTTSDGGDGIPGGGGGGPRGAETRASSSSSSRFQATPATSTKQAGKKRPTSLFVWSSSGGERSSFSSRQQAGGGAPPLPKNNTNFNHNEEEVVIKSVKKIGSGPSKVGTATELKLRAKTVSDAQAWADALRAEEECLPVARAATKAGAAAVARAFAARQSVDGRNVLPFFTSVVAQANSHTPLRAGWLRKRGELNPAWKKRYFALFSGVTCTTVNDERPPADEPVLMYFKNQAKFAALVDGGDRPYKGAVRLGAVTEMRRKHAKDTGAARIALVTGDRTWLLAPLLDENNQENGNDRDGNDLDAWWFALEGACHCSRRFLQEHTTPSSKSKAGGAGGKLRSSARQRNQQQQQHTTRPLSAPVPRHASVPL